MTAERVFRLKCPKVKVPVCICLPWGFSDNPPLEEELFLTIQEGSSEGWLWEMGETKMDQKQEHDVINSQPISTVALARG